MSSTISPLTSLSFSWPSLNRAFLASSLAKLVLENKNSPNP